MVHRYEWATVAVLIVLAVSQWLGILLRLWTLSDILSVVPYFIFTAMFGVFLWGLGKSIENKLGKKTTTVEEGKGYDPDLNLEHLAVHYLRVKGLPDTPDSAQRRYITNDRTRKASRIHEIPDWLAPAIKGHKMSWYAYDDAKTLRRVLTAIYSIDEVDPIPKTLSLMKKNGKLVMYDPHVKLLSELEGHNLEGLQVLNLTRRYFFSEKKRTLLIKFSKTETKSEVWLAPPYIFELIEKRMIAEENKGMRFWESSKKWCERNGYTFVDRRFPESALLVEGS